MRALPGVHSLEYAKGSETRRVAPDPSPTRGMR
jgi:hypothetical protein